MAVRLYRFLDVHNLLYDYQFGFRKNHSTTLALIDVVDEIFQHLDKDEIGIGIYLDLKKAFDTVDHNRPILLCPVSRFSRISLPGSPNFRSVKASFLANTNLPL